MGLIKLEQVKEKRKSNSKSNKWRCVVCNQHQSIRKVFAQGPFAKDLRFFVQSFNISRSHSPSPPLPTEQPLPPQQCSKRPRSDWTEFLDPAAAADHGYGRISQPGGDDFGPEIVTELPVDGMFEKVKVNKSAVGGGNGGGGELNKPVVSKRNVKEASNRAKEGDEKPRIWQKREAASKWSCYVTRENDCDGTEAPADDWNGDVLESLMNEEKVDDEEIHPDFLSTN